MRLSFSGLKKLEMIFLISILACCALLIPVKSVHADDVQLAMWFMDDLNITQVPGGDYSHAGTLNFDVKGVNNTDIKAPFDCEIVEIFYGEDAANTVIIQSTSPVRYADGTVDFMSLAVGHDNDISDCYIGKTISQGEVYCQNGNYGVATGVHSHVTCIRGKYTDNPGWVQVSTGNWTFQNAIDPTAAFFLYPSTNVFETMELTFKKDEVPPTISYNADYHLKNSRGFFFFSVTDDETGVGVDPASIKLMLWEYGQDESEAIEKEAEMTGTADRYTVFVNLNEDESLYYAKIVAADLFGNTATAYISKYKPFPFFTVDKSSSTGVYIVKKGEVAVHRAPYDKINGKATRNGTLHEGAKVEVVGTYINSYDHVWYQLANEQWVYSDNLEKLYSLRGALLDILNFIDSPHIYFVNNQALHTGEVYNNNGAKAPAALRAAAALSDDGDIPYEEGYTIRFSTRNVTPEESYYGADSGVPLHTIAFHENGGFVDFESIEIYEGNAYGELPAASRYGYAFTGWYTDPVQGDLVLPGDICTQDLDLYAHWAEQVSDTGKCGDTLTWTLTGDGLLKIEGSGSMTSAPWYTKGYNQTITEVSLPEGLTYIYSNAFRSSNLMSVALPQSLRGLGENAFSYCRWLTRVDLPEGVSTIPASCFAGCVGLTGKLDISDSITSIGQSAFAGCTGLTELTIPDGMSVAAGAFNNCTGLTKVKLPVDIELKKQFIGCTNVEEIEYTPGTTGAMKVRQNSSDRTHHDNHINNTLEYQSRENLKTVIFDEGVVRVAEYVFYLNGGLESVTLPSTITSIGAYAFNGPSNAEFHANVSGLAYLGTSAFSGCKQLENLTDIGFPGALTAVNENTFAGCTGLTELTIPDGMTVAAGAFDNCTGLTKVKMPADIELQKQFIGCTNVEEIEYTPGTTGAMKARRDTSGTSHYGDHVNNTLEYQSRENLKTVIFDEGVVSIGGYTYSGNYGNLKSVTLPSTITSIGAYAFSGLSNAEFHANVSGLAYLGISAFSGCKQLVDLAAIGFPGTLTAVSDSAFLGCTGITELTIPDSVTSIGQTVFSGCTGITELTISDSTTVGSEAFKNCTGLTKVKLPVDIELKKQFIGCTNVEEIEYTPGTTGGMKARYTGERQNYEDHYTNTLEYQSRLNLKKIVYNEGVTSIAGYACNGNYGNMESVTLPSTITSIGAYAFNGPSNAEFHANVLGLAYLGPSAFSNCKQLGNLTDIGFPGTLTAVSENTFAGCTGLTELMIPDGMTVAAGAFDNCTGLTKVKMPADIELQKQFIGCTNVEEIEYTPGTTGAMKARRDTSGTSHYGDHVNNTLEYQSRENLNTVIFDEGVVYVGTLAYRYSRHLENVKFASTIGSIGSDAFAGQSAAVYYGYKDSYCESYAAGAGFTFIPLNYPMIANEHSVLRGGEQYTFTATVYSDIDTFTDEVAWSVEGNDSENTAITENGVLDVDRKEYADSLTIVAGYEGVSATVSIPVERLEPDFNESDMLLPGNLTKIEEEAFMDMPVITVRCPETLTEIGSGAFRNCLNLRNIYIPADVQTIADDAFDGCTNLIIWGETGSYAETYAGDKGIRFAESGGN